MMYNMIDKWPRDYHAVLTVQFGELVEGGVVNWDDPSWHWDAYSDEQYARLNSKIEGRFWFREISIVPPGMWKRAFIEKMNEIMPKYKLAYKALDDGFNFLATKDEYTKLRDIYSDFPQTVLGDNQDYASQGHDLEKEVVTEGNVLDRLLNFYDDYDDVDVKILDELEILFSSLISVSINGL